MHVNLAIMLRVGNGLRREQRARCVILLQATLFDEEQGRSAELQCAINLVAAAGAEERGAIFTRREIVEFMLDLVGYSVDVDLWRYRLLEPSCGRGDFLLVAMERLLAAYIRTGGRPEDADEALRDAIRAVELHHSTFQLISEQVRKVLLAANIPPTKVEKLVKSWLLEDDFLVCDFPAGFTHIIGNPPYVRQERIPDVLLTYYRSRYRTIYDRADLYIPFIERSLQLLDPKGKLAFICADRWMKNKYGGPLRTLVAKHFCLEYYVDMTGVDAFHSTVNAYPAIMVFAGDHVPNATTRVVYHPEIDGSSLTQLAQDMKRPGPVTDSSIHEMAHVTKGASPWIFTTSHDELAVLRRVENAFPALEDTGCKVGIGVATGCDRVFIGQLEELPVEPDRKLPLVMAPDIRSGQILYSGKGIVNPFTADGGLVHLTDYPQLAAYLSKHEQVIRNRHVAKINPTRWYRTIDRIYPALTRTPKLLIPDIKGEANVVYDTGEYYPHHNLYYVTATEWDLFALQSMLRSTVVRLFITSYSIRMRGNFLRFQAQNLRRIHLPRWDSLASTLQIQLRQTALAADWVAANELACDAFQLSSDDRAEILQAVKD